MLTGNKGEWSEIYTLLKIISQKNLYPGDKDLNKIKELIFPIIKILRDELNERYIFSYENDLVIINDSKDEIIRIPIKEFENKANFLFDKLIEPSNGPISIPEIESFLNLFKNKSLKAKSSSKNDISVIVHDYRTGTMPELGFSIKSQIGSASTLLNAGKTTNFIYKIANSNLKDNDIQRINKIEGRSKIRDRIIAIREKKGNFIFTNTENDIFGNNLILIDSCLPKIISDLLLAYYSSDKSSLIDLLKIIEEENPLNFNLKYNHPYYSYKVKRFIVDIALGMMPSKTWTGQFEATGGYLVVKEDGDVLCYHIYNLNNFEDYLIGNTKFDTASSTKHEFGKLYKEGKDIYFKLNLQIRFKK